mmetsp:Transcript_24507/g.53312  ORF Transcript_24507/g.53312 Transcript_24507/m.53312 type:complete len:606 (+) Transcript_24507:233-2050(+)|eukprot:CAMPEP_0206424808 /NCGR_PEP_ID=MMETSP0324_2-20121206/3439_1 /ASSEMBLY_ACC=CAM_ASM_000836 /TAXON_ID=2866 /ORGANISM="Crypthecodinium cohnii, Strain Seligo" /LENGTH=605 /DNA_ID=CAMNT_0053889515 /DNA_START=172 /DNA_END=1989 /DNA_ORIENTATION=-
MASPGPGSRRSARASDANFTGFNVATRDLRNSFIQDGVVEKFTQNMAITAFTTWVNSKLRGWEMINELFLKENQSPAGGPFDDRCTKGARGLSRSQWVTRLASLGFKDASMAGDVFDHILAENGEGTWKPEHEGGKVEPFIYRPQFRRFEVRIMAVNSTLSATMENSPARRFIDFIRQRNGNSTIRAWCVDIDVRQAGKVAQTDFARVCRRLGFSTQARLIWENLRPDKQVALEVHDLDPVEADNLEDYADALWNGLGFDLEKVWSFMDPNNQMYVSKEDFVAAAREMGFRGDAELVFRGLNTSGVRRGVTKDEFMYIKKISRLARRRLGGMQQGYSAVNDLITWVQRELGGAHELLAKLGLGGQKNLSARILVSDLAARLTALGFEGDALGAAARAARMEGGCTISADALYALLSGGRYVSGEEPPKTPSLPSRSPVKRNRTPSLRALETKPGWDNGVNDIVAANLRKCQGDRSYFDRSTTPTKRRDQTPPPPQQGRARTPLGRATGVPDANSRRGMSPRRPLSARRMEPRSEQPKWEENFDGHLQTTNTTMGAMTRRYFSDPHEKPVREQMRKLVETRIAKRQARQAREGWGQTLRPEDLASY